MNLLGDRGVVTPAFAAGGFHAGGLRIVGERGPELESTGPSRIWNAEQTAALLSAARGPRAAGMDGERDKAARLEALVEKLTEEVSALRAEARATATHTARMVRLQDDWTGRGLTVKTDADTPLDVKTAP